MNPLKELYYRFKYRDKTFSELAEQHELIIKAARRCAYDFKHCSDQIYWAYRKSNLDEESSDLSYYEKSSHWSDIAKHWISLFTDEGAKNYRHRLHRDIFELECEIRRLEKLLEENGIKHYRDVPF